MLTADASLQVRVGLVALGNPHADQCTNAVVVDDLEGISLQETLLEVGAHDATFNIVSAEPEGHLGEVVGAEGEKLRLFGNLVRHQGGTRSFDHGTNEHIKLGALDLFRSLGLD